jgi:hypothetical protein
MVERLSEAWAGREAMVDLQHVPSGERTLSSPSHIVSRFFMSAREAGLPLVPVTGPERDTAYQAAVREVVATDRGGACIRIRADDFLARDLSGLDELLADLGLKANDAHLVLDLGAVVEGVPRYLAATVERALRELPMARDWRSLTLTATGFPRYLGELGHGIDEVPRHEWALWRAMPSDLPRRPTFGDYAVANPNVEELDPRTIKLSASIRYTSDERWIVARGRNIQQYGAGQYRDLSRLLMSARNVYKGADFSAGDRFIRDCAEGNEGVGNATTWRWVGTNHHLTFVARQLATVP